MSVEQKTSFKLKWLQEQFTRLRKLYSAEELSNEELKVFLVNEYNKRKTVNGRLYNNTTKDNKIMSIESFINMFLNDDNILTGYNTLVKNQYNNKTIAIDALVYILGQRGVYKKKMQEAEKGSTEYVYYKVLQLTFKILANSYYGILSMGESIFYNPHIQNSITTSGQDLISTAIYLVEAFVANNEKFKSMDEIIGFVTNVCSEKNYNILDYVDTPKTKAEVKSYIKEQSEGFNVNDDILDKLLSRRSDEELSKIYYKNQILKLFENKYFKDKVNELVHSGKEDPEFRDLVVTICNYNHVAWDRFIRISQQKRRGSIVTDTDSTFIYLGNSVKVIQKIINDYTEETKLNICNLYIYIITEALTRTFWTFTGNCNIPEEFRPIINMKNEFLYSRILTTRNKKNYAGWLMSELGKPIPGNDPAKHLDMKGLAIRKSTVAKSLREEFQNLLVNDILTPEKIDVLKVMKHYNDISDIVSKSIKEGKTEFLLPKSVDPYDRYKNPGSVEQVKSTIIWNALEPNNTIVPPDNVKLIKIAASTLKHPAMIKFQQDHPDKFEIIKNTVFETKEGELDISKNGLTAVSIPLDLDEVPDYLRPLINYDLMVNANVKNANILLESLGLYCTDDKTKKTNYKSNIVEWI